METFKLADGRTLYVHPLFMCEGRTCVIHNPADHAMRDWPLHWRDDRGIFERICEHGVCHPDPSQFEYWQLRDEMWQAVHGCDGCCDCGHDV